MPLSSSHPSRQSDVDQTNFVALSLAPFGWRRRMAERLHAGDSPERILDALIAEQPPSREIDRHTLTAGAKAAMARAKTAGIALVTWDDSAYPAALSAIVDPPPALWVRGNVAVLSGPAVAIVGSRAGSPYGLTVAEHLAADLAARGHRDRERSGARRGFRRAPRRARGAAAPRLAYLVPVLTSCTPPNIVRLPETSRPTAARSSASWCRGRRHSSSSSRCATASSAVCPAQSSSWRPERRAGRSSRPVVRSIKGVRCSPCRGTSSVVEIGAGTPFCGTVQRLSSRRTISWRSWACPRLDGRARRHRATLGTLSFGACPPGESCDLEAISERTGLTPTRLLPKLFDLEMRGLVRRVGGGRFARV